MQPPPVAVAPLAGDPAGGHPPEAADPPAEGAPHPRQRFRTMDGTPFALYVRGLQGAGRRLSMAGSAATRRVSDLLHFVAGGGSHAPVHWASGRQRRLLLLQILCEIYIALSVPVLVAFPDAALDGAVVLLNALADVVLLGTAAQAVLGRRRQGQTQPQDDQQPRRKSSVRAVFGESPQLLQPRARRRWLLDAVAVLAVLPVDYAVLAQGGDPAPWRLNRLLRVAPLIYRMWFAHSYRVNADVLGVVKASAMIFLCAHFAACAWFGVHSAPGGYMADADDPRPRLYLMSLYWGLQTILKAPTDVTLDELDAFTDGEMLVSMAAMLLGVVVFVVLLGQVASVIASFNAEVALYSAKVEGIKRFARQKALPEHLTLRMLEHLRSMYAHADLGESVLDELPPALRKDALLHICSKLVSRVNFLSSGQPGFVNSVILQFELQHFSPGDVLRWEGEVSTGMFLVSSGALEVSKAGVEATEALAEGDCYGELWLLLAACDYADFDQRALATVRATAFSGIYFLANKAFRRVALQYQTELRPLVVAAFAANKRQRQHPLLHQPPQLPYSAHAAGAPSGKQQSELDSLARQVQGLHQAMLHRVRELERRLDGVSLGSSSSSSGALSGAGAGVGAGAGAGAGAGPPGAVDPE